MWKRSRIIVAGIAILIAVVVYWACTITRKLEPRELVSLIDRDALVVFSAGRPAIDSGWEVIFLPKGRVHVVQFGNVVRHFDGTWAVNTSSAITFDLRDRFGEPWPFQDLAFLRDAWSPILQPIGSGKVSENFRPVSPVELEQARKLLPSWTTPTTDAAL